MSFVWRTRVMALFAALVSLLPASSALATSREKGDRVGHVAQAGATYLAQSEYSANENAGRIPITIERTTSLAQPEAVVYGVNPVGPQAGQNFDAIPSTRAEIPAGQSSYTFYVTINDQGIHGPTRYASAYVGGTEPRHAGQPEPGDHRAAAERSAPESRRREPPRATCQVPSDGDPLQHVRWYVFGDTVAPGQFAEQYASSNPAWAQALHTLAYSPGSWSYRFWMWNQPTVTLAQQRRAVPGQRRADRAGHDRAAQYLLTDPRHMSEPSEHRGALPAMDQPAGARYR